MPSRISEQFFKALTSCCSPLALSVWVLVSLVAAISGPFGTFTDLSFSTRLFYWSVIAGVSLASGRAIRRVIEQRLSERPIWQVDLTSVAVITPTLAVMTWLLSPRLVSISPEKIPGLGGFLGYVFLIVGFVTVARRMREHFSAERSKARPVRLVERLPEDIRGDILRLTGRDHHVEVTTSRGVAVVRLRLGDAIAEMEPVEGYCTHRSHWVAKAAITGVEREGGRIFLRLVNGDKVPVSRKYRPGLEEAGII